MGLPVIGESLEFFTDSYFAAKRHQKYGNVFKTSVFGRPTVFVRGWEAVQFILSNENRNLLFAGHETLTSSLASFCLLAAQNRDILQRLREEVSLICPEGALNLDILKEMTYLELVLKEVLRIVAPVGGGFRQITQDCDFQGYRFPQGWQILYEISYTHKLPELYAEPEAFNPDRFNQPKPVEQQKYGYIPFGGGVRECVGKEFARLEMKILAIALLRDYDWKLEPNQDLSMTVIPTPHPRDGLRVSFQKLGAI